MNPLLFADWGRMNRQFTRVMWAVAAIMACVVCVVLSSAGTGHAARVASTPRATGTGTGVAVAR